ncbi:MULTISPECIES: cob(I)yrinic acid a,c-diamide adenosyltransferase [Cytobacillus]|jgi:cob(I)alamin adenosyltransferase|uniref:Corrinoid adenosyltransferase n=2 Tax=Cytobacillus TaxID=2675230 RepID=A0ABX3D177_9BACI|nr:MULTISPECIES: cob(I)yrinic acid a,c-diamide adenosyltransferase [Cytobacillus]EFV74372.1 ATP:cob(I)alamin adenosyltransferase [Bacillus sp. 2_A_57_CT2]MBY0157910.1 cob(I)yrinic acid a,c-diamide adenosyltransferase [Cytobacillus firmus]MBU8732615.1 cob(I)yrinic acid a,c-diamide adenosyltransferase [Cytobacillus oceanisediminis]MBU8772777.1 cob(I)yrinic acid a,c-diamide adenosyltransferase [Cytobacillus oceanisediminis]MCM3245942.1 cob(I)yrinic acid a,c-diamide adenosyltransferase [Cytobacill
MKLYTRTGDEGKTSIIGGRVEKDDVRVEAYGTVDEVNCFVGQAMTQLDPSIFQDVLEDLEKIQHELFDCGGDLANVSKKRELKLTKESVDYLETKIDQLIEEAPKLERFILPGGAPASASIHIARTVTRRAERLVVSLKKADPETSAVALKFLNRLSDYFFALARVVNFRLNQKDVEYVRSANVFREGKRKEDKE